MSAIQHHRFSIIIFLPKQWSPIWVWNLTDLHFDFFVQGGKWWDLRLVFNMVHFQSLCKDFQLDFGKNLQHKVERSQCGSLGLVPSSILIIIIIFFQIVILFLFRKNHDSEFSSRESLLVQFSLII